MKRHCNIPIFVPEVGCPHQCVFCNQAKITDRDETVSDAMAIEIIEKHLSTIQNDTTVEIAFFGGSFTGIDLKIQERLLKLAHDYIKQGRVSGIRISTRPDYISIEKLELLKKYGVTAIELGAQSLNNDVLRIVERGHSVEDVEKAVSLIREFDFELGLQMMIGLPGDDQQGATLTAEKIISLGANTTRIYPCLVISDTKLEEMYMNGKYTPLTIREAVEIVADIVPMFEQANINIIRVGLHPSEGLTSGTTLIAGPFHPSFRQLVESEIWQRLFNERLASRSETDKGVVKEQSVVSDHGLYTKTSALTIYCSSKEVNNAAGYNGSNRKHLEEMFKKVSFVKKETLKEREFYVEYN